MRESSLAAILNQMDAARHIRLVAMSKPVHGARDGGRFPWAWCGMWQARRYSDGFPDEARMVDELERVTCHGCLRSLSSYAQYRDDSEDMRENRIERLRDAEAHHG